MRMRHALFFLLVLSAAGEEAVVVVSTDMDCVFSLTGQDLYRLNADTQIELSAEEGTYTVVAYEIHGTERWNAAVTLAPGKNATLRIRSADSAPMVASTVSHEQSYGVFQRPMVAWEAIYGGYYYDGILAATRIAADGDRAGGYCAVGYTSSKTDGNKGVWILRIDHDGSILWERVLRHGGTAAGLHEEATAVTRTRDRGFVVAGYTETQGNGGRDLQFHKLGASGEAEWTAVAGSRRNQGVSSIVQLSSGDFLATGYDELSGGRNDSDVYLVRIDENGTLVSEMRYGSSNEEEGFAIAETSDGGFALAASVYRDSGSQQDDAWILKIGEQGDTIWERVLGGPHSDGARFIREHADGSLVVAGWSRSPDAENLQDWYADFWVFRLSSAGRLLWQTVFGTEHHDLPVALEVTAGGGCVVLGVSGSWSGHDKTLFRIEIDGEGYPVMREVLTIPANDEITAAVYDAGGAHLLVGMRRYDGPRGSDGLLLETESRAR